MAGKQSQLHIGTGRLIHTLPIQVMASTQAATPTQTPTIDIFRQILETRIQELITDSHRETIRHYKAQIASHDEAANLLVSTKINELRQSIKDKRKHQEELIRILIPCLNYLATEATVEMAANEVRLGTLERFVNQ